MEIIIPPTKRIIKKTVDHQGIGGKEILIERTMTAKEAGDANDLTSANFYERRPDLVSPKTDNAIVHYGQVKKGGACFGYLVADDELEPEDTKPKTKA